MTLKRIAVVIFALMPLFAVAQRFVARCNYTDEGGKLIVDASINSHAGRFLLDNGAPCAVTAKFAQRAGVAYTGNTVQVYDSNGQMISEDVLLLDSLNFGGVCFTQLAAVSFEKNDVVEQMGLDGLIGYNLLRNGALMIDSRSKMVVLASSSDAYRYFHLLSDSDKAVPMTGEKYLTMIPVQVGLSRDTVMLDLGDEKTYTMSTASFQRLRGKDCALKILNEGRGVLSMGAAGVENSAMKWRVLADSMLIGDLRLDSVTTVTTSAPTSRIGSSILNFACLTIDYPNNVCYLQPFSPDSIPVLYKPEWSVVLTCQNNILTAGLVWDANGSTMKGGERVVEVNGKRFDGKIDLHEAITAGILNMPGNTASIRYIDGTSGKEMSATIYQK